MLKSMFVVEYTAGIAIPHTCERFVIADSFSQAEAKFRLYTKERGLDPVITSIAFFGEVLD